MDDQSCFVDEARRGGINRGPMLKTIRHRSQHPVGDSEVMADRSTARWACTFAVALCLVGACLGVAQAQTVTEFSVPTPNAAPWDITVGPDGNLWFTEEEANKIGRITPSGVITEFSSGITPNAAPMGIASGPDGNLWFTEPGVNRIGRITPAGVITEFSVVNTNIAGALSYITAGPDGNLWFTDANDRIGRITPSGVITEFSSGITPGASPLDIATGPDGNLWFTENRANKIGRITPNGVITEFTAGTTAYGSPYGITTGPDGNLWFTELYVFEPRSAVVRMTPVGVTTEFTADTNFNPSINLIVAGPDGNFWFTDGLGIGRITLTGVVTEFSATTVDAGPMGITTGPDGNIWYTEVNGVGNRIGRITIASAPPPPPPILPLTISLIDPVPQYVDGGGIAAPLSALASATQTVMGVSADGAAQIVVRVSGANAGDPITLTLLDANGNPTTDTCGEGYLEALPGGGSCSSAIGGSITITAENNGSGSATAFAVYHAPQDFVRPDNAVDSSARTRTVSIQVIDNGSSTTQVIQIVRPPVVLVHGLWGSAGDWHGSNGDNGVFETLQSSNLFPITFANYDAPLYLSTSVPTYPLNNNQPLLTKWNTLGFKFIAQFVLLRIRNVITNYKTVNHIAAVRADIVAHSMGGDVARTLPQVTFFLNSYNYNLGVVHKLITIGTPHQGSPLAAALLQSSNACVRQIFAANGYYAFSSVTPLPGTTTINGAVGDLEPTSSALSALHAGTPIIPTAMIGAKLSSWELVNAGNSPAGRYLRLVCGTYAGDPLALALTPSGWPGLLGASDSVVPLSSQFDGESSYAQSLPFSIPYAVHTSAMERFGFGPPGELDQASGIPSDVLQLLNTPVSNSVFETKP